MARSQATKIVAWARMIELSVSATHSVSVHCFFEALVDARNTLAMVVFPIILPALANKSYGFSACYGFATIIADCHDDSLFSFDLPITEYVVADYDSFELSQSTFGYHANEP